MIRRLVFSALCCAFVTAAISNDNDDSPPVTIDHATNLSEARARAKMIHEMARGSLQVMHRDFFDEENMHAIPSSSLEDVFHEMGRSFDVQMKWLVVNTDVVNIDHKAETEFDRLAVKELAAGKAYSDKMANARYYFAGPIRLGSQCLKCHVKRRSSNEDRTAGLVITMPVSKGEAP